MPSKHDHPTCCDAAMDLISWMPKGLRVPSSDKWRQLQRESRYGYTQAQYGPEREGWCIYIESDGIVGPSFYRTAVCCPFCGTKLEN